MVAAVVLAALLLHHSPDALAGSFSFERGATDLPEVALTFDGGSDAGDTDRILRILADRGVRATFFLTGRFLTGHPALARRIAASGHEVGNHTWSHPHLTSWRSDRRQRTLPTVDRPLLLHELAETAAAWEALTGRPMAPLWRAPYGEVNEELGSWAADAGWRHVGWSREERGRRTLDSLDWVADRSSSLYLSSAAILERLLSFGDADRGLNGGVVLMHLSTAREDPGSARLGELIDALEGRGYRLVTIRELISRESHDGGGDRASVALRTGP